MSRISSTTLLSNSPGSLCPLIGDTMWYADANYNIRAGKKAEDEDVCSEHGDSVRYIGDEHGAAGDGLTM